MYNFRAFARISSCRVRINAVSRRAIVRTAGKFFWFYYPFVFCESSWGLTLIVARENPQPPLEHLVTALVNLMPKFESII